MLLRPPVTSVTGGRRSYVSLLAWHSTQKLSLMTATKQHGGSHNTNVDVSVQETMSDVMMGHGHAFLSCMHLT